MPEPIRIGEAPCDGCPYDDEMCLYRFVAGGLQPNLITLDRPGIPDLDANHDEETLEDVGEELEGYLPRREMSLQSEVISNLASQTVGTHGSSRL